MKLFSYCLFENIPASVGPGLSEAGQCWWEEGHDMGTITDEYSIKYVLSGERRETKATGLDYKG